MAAAHLPRYSSTPGRCGAPPPYEEFICYGAPVRLQPSSKPELVISARLIDGPPCVVARSFDALDRNEILYIERKDPSKQQNNDLRIRNGDKVYIRHHRRLSRNSENRFMKGQRLSRWDLFILVLSLWSSCCTEAIALLWCTRFTLDHPRKGSAPGATIKRAATRASSSSTWLISVSS